MYNSVAKEPLFRVYDSIFTKSGKYCDTFTLQGDEIAGLEAEAGSSGKRTWTIMRDTSVVSGDSVLYQTFAEDKPTGPSGPLMNHVEIVSPILTYDDVAKPKSKGGHFARVLDTVLPANGALAYWNNTLTSNHVHMSYGSAPYEPHVLFKLCMAWLYFEPLLSGDAASRHAGPARESECLLGPSSR
jgi:hypothetical protein